MEGKVVLTGEVVSYPEVISNKRGKKLYRTYMEVLRTSLAVDIIPITFTEKSRLHKIYVREGKNIVGKTIAVQGEIRSHNENGHVFITVLVGNKVCVCNQDKAHCNVVNITGYIAKLKDIRETPLGSRIVDSIIAINCGRRKYYVPVIFWNGLAINVKERYRVGSKVRFIGRLQSRCYSKVVGYDNQGNVQMEARTTYEVSVLELKKL